MELGRMADRPESRFDAAKVRRLAAVNKSRRVEVEFCDADEKQHVVTLPVEAAVALGRLICDLSEATPFLNPPGSSKDDGST
jgi:hypothetical protein